jgi:hypothetical protein
MRVVLRTWYSQFDDFNTQTTPTDTAVVSNHLTYVYRRFVFPDRYIPLGNLCRWPGGSKQVLSGGGGMHHDAVIQMVMLL